MIFCKVGAKINQNCFDTTKLLTTILNSYKLNSKQGNAYYFLGFKADKPNNTVCRANLYSHIITESSRGYPASGAVGPICMATPRATFLLARPIILKLHSHYMGAILPTKDKLSTREEQRWDFCKIFIIIKGMECRLFGFWIIKLVMSQGNAFYLVCFDSIY